MTAIQYALQDIYRSIPRVILEKVFIVPNYTQLRRNSFVPASMDSEIINKIINGPVRRDCDIAGATETTIPLVGLGMEVIDKDKYLIHIPKERTNGRTITSALSLVLYEMNNISPSSWMLGGMGTTVKDPAGSYCDNGALASTAALGKSFQPMLLSESSNVRMVNDNTLLVEDLIFPMNANAHLRCILANDKEFSTLAVPAYKHFGKLCTLACKEYIYNNLIIDIDKAELVGGQELGVFKTIVESYSDAREQYDEFYNDKWRKIQFMSDEKRHTRYIKALIGRFK